MTPDPETCRLIAQWLAQSSATVAFTGAGISTESGIPDFRSPGGIWAKYQPVYFDDFMAHESSRQEYWRQKSEGLRDFADAKPNVGHRALAHWEASGRLSAVITQNIDELHQQAGSQRVLELHGTTRKIACMDCGERFELEPYTSLFLVTGRVPDCPSCEGRLKHATVSFGQSLPQEVLAEAVALSQQAELFFAIGSSLVVEPAASLPRIAKQHGARLVIINRDPTPLDASADAVLHASIGEVLTAIDSEML
jgi:NAD-dependent deacetylase